MSFQNPHLLHQEIDALKKKNADLAQKNDELMNKNTTLEELIRRYQDAYSSLLFNTQKNEGMALQRERMMREELELALEELKRYQNQYS